MEFSAEGLPKADAPADKVGSRKTLKRVGTIKYVFKILFMKRIKIAMAALVVTVGLVASLAFTQKPPQIVDYNYDNAASQQTYIPMGFSGQSIVRSELVTTSSWSLTASVGSHANNSDLLAIEFDLNEFGTLQAAINAVDAEYAANSLPADGVQFTDTPTGYKVRVYRF